MNSCGNLASELRALIEGLHPDLRKHFRPSLLGKVVAVHDDDEDAESYYRVDVVVGANEDEDEPGLSLPKVPVASLFAQDGYGIFALPEVGAEVTVSFHDGDVTKPYVESPIFYGNQAPAGFTSGTIAIRGKHGQKIEMKPHANEIVMFADSIKVIRSTKGQERTGGDFDHRIGGDRICKVSKTERKNASSSEESVLGAVQKDFGRLKETIQGNRERNVGGKASESIQGASERIVVADDSESVLQSKRLLVGENFEMIAVGDIVLQTTPGNISIGSLGGNIGIGAENTVIPADIKMGGSSVPTVSVDGVQVNVGGSATTNTLVKGARIEIGESAISDTNIDGMTVKLGGDAAIESAVLGDQLVSFLTSLLTALLTPLQMGNLGAPTAPNPAFASQISLLLGQVNNLKSTKVKIALS